MDFKIIQKAFLDAGFSLSHKNGDWEVEISEQVSIKWTDDAVKSLMNIAGSESQGSSSVKSVFQISSKKDAKPRSGRDISVIKESSVLLYGGKATAFRASKLTGIPREELTGFEASLAVMGCGCLILVADSGIRPLLKKHDVSFVEAGSDLVLIPGKNENHDHEQELEDE